MQPPETSHQPLLSPEISTLIIIDHQAAFEACFGHEDIRSVENGVVNLIEAAGEIDIPVIASFMETNFISSKLSSRLEKAMLQLTRFNRTSADPWDDLGFEKAVQVANRPCLLIAGLSVETSLTYTALHALAMGFDVFVIRDACLGYSEQSIDISFDRLIQAGVVPVSWRQVLLEWQHKSVDVGLLRRVLKSRRLQKL